MELMGTAEVATLLGVSRQRVHQLIQSHADFPKPVAVLTATRVWLAGDVQRWYLTHRKSPE